LDCVKAAMVMESLVTSLSAQADTVAAKGTKVRSEGRGKKWYLNGALVAVKEGGDDDVVNFAVGHHNTESWYPCISIKGSCSISAIELAMD